VELVVVLAVLPALLVMIHTVLVSTISAVDFVEAESKHTQIMRALRNVFLEDLSACCLPEAKRPKTTEAKETYRSLFLGIQNKNRKNSSLSFITRRPSRTPAGRASIDLNEVGYELRSNSKDHRYLELIRREQPLYDDRPTQGGKQTVLYDRVLSFEAWYFDGAEWVREWDAAEEKDLPLLVKIVIRVAVKVDETEEEHRADILVPLIASRRKIVSPNH